MQFNRLLHFGKFVFIRKTQATLKLGILFQDWLHVGIGGGVDPIPPGSYASTGAAA